MLLTATASNLRKKSLGNVRTLTTHGQWCSTRTSKYDMHVHCAIFFLYFMKFFIYCSCYIHYLMYGCIFIFMFMLACLISIYIYAYTFVYIYPFFFSVYSFICCLLLHARKYQKVNSLFILFYFCSAVFFSVTKPL